MSQSLFLQTKQPLQFESNHISKERTEIYPAKNSRVWDIWLLFRIIDLNIDYICGDYRADCATDADVFP